MSKEWQYKNRTYVGQIKHVRPDNGTIDVVLTNGEPETVNIPFAGLSVARSIPVGSNGDSKLSVDGVKASWIRYMPQVGDFVECGYTAENQCEALSYTAFGSDPESSSKRLTGAYGQLRRHANERRFNLREFNDLQPGEWDMRSSGAAYVRGDRYGELTLRGGAMVKVKLQKRNTRITTEVGTLCSSAAGNLGLTTVHSTTLFPLRYRSRFYLDAPPVPPTPLDTVETLRVEVDNVGNTKVSTQIAGAAAGLEVSYGALGITASAGGPVSITSGSETNIDANVAVRLGSLVAAVDPAVNGRSLIAYLEEVARQLTASATSGDVAVAIRAAFVSNPFISGKIFLE